MDAMLFDEGEMREPPPGETARPAGTPRLRLAELCEQHVAYQWLCGGVTVNYHMLSDFRSQNPQRLEKALQNCRELAEQREKTAKVSGRKPTEARASSTDPEARTMKFANGGDGPGYNVQFSTDTESGVIVGVAVTNQGTDNAERVPMLEQLQEQHGRTPEEALVDGGFATRAAVEEAAELGCAARRRNGSTPSAATGTCNRCRSAGRRNAAGSPCGMQLLTT